MSVNPVFLPHFHCVPAWIGIHIRELIPLGALDDIVQNQHGTMVAALEDQDVLILGLFVVQDLVDLEGHGLARPHVGGLREPSI